MAQFIDLVLPPDLEVDIDCNVPPPKNLSWREAYLTRVRANLYNADSNPNGVIDLSDSRSHPQKLPQITDKQFELMSPPQNHDILSKILQLSSVGRDNVNQSEQMCVVTDGPRALGQILDALSDPKDAFIITAPYLPYFYGFEKLCSAKIFVVPMEFEKENFRLKFDDLQNAYDKAQFMGLCIKGIVLSEQVSQSNDVHNFTKKYPHIHLIKTGNLLHPASKQHAIKTVILGEETFFIVASTDQRIIEYCKPLSISNIQLNWLRNLLELDLIFDRCSLAKSFLQETGISCKGSIHGYFLCLDLSKFAERLGEKSGHQLFMKLLVGGVHLMPCVILGLEDTLLFLIDSTCDWRAWTEGLDRIQKLSQTAKPGAEIRTLEEDVSSIMKSIRASDWISSQSQDSWSEQNPEAAAELRAMISQETAPS